MECGASRLASNCLREDVGRATLVPCVELEEFESSRRLARLWRRAEVLRATYRQPPEATLVGLASTTPRNKKSGEPPTSVASEGLDENMAN